MENLKYTLRGFRTSLISTGLGINSKAVLFHLNAFETVFKEWCKHFKIYFFHDFNLVLLVSCFQIIKSQFFISLTCTAGFLFSTYNL